MNTSKQYRVTNRVKNSDNIIQKKKNHKRTMSKKPDQRFLKAVIKSHFQFNSNARRKFLEKLYHRVKVETARKSFIVFI